jgi:hypothetical protein
MKKTKRTQTWIRHLDRILIAGTATLFLVSLLVLHGITLYLQPYEQGNEIPIPNAITTGEGEHPPLEGACL